MNRNDFLRIMETSGPSDRQTIGEIGELITIFPYFQSAYMLFLKGLQNTSDVKFENQLRTTAMHIADREVLYYYLKHENKPEEKITPVAVEENPAETNSSDSQQVVIETARNSEEFINDIEKSTGEAGSDDQTEESVVGKGHSVMVSSEAEDDDSTATVLIIDEESGDVEEKIIYMDPGFSFPELPDLLELDTQENVEPVPAGESDSMKSEERQPEISEKQIQADLINKFILTNPRIEPKKVKTDVLTEDISKPFTEERGDFVTETLARIYINQGYYSRAIDIYEKLCLKFPEKNSYFASQIEKVKDLIK